MKSKNILFIGGFFGDNELPNGICAHAVIRELIKKEYNVTFLAMNDGYQTKEETIDNIFVKRIRADEITRLNAWRGRHTTCIDNIWYKFRIFLKNIRTFCFLWAWPFNAPINYLLTLKSAKNIVQNKKIDTVISLYAPFNALYVGHKLKKSNPKLKYVTYFLDSLSGGVHPRFTSKDWVCKKGMSWERKLLDNADSVVIMKAHEQHHREHSVGQPFYSNIQVLDIPLFGSELTSEVDDCSESVLDSGKINIVYMGSLKKNLKNPQYFIKLFNNSGMTNVNLTFIGNAANCENMLTSGADNLKHISVIPHEKVCAVLKSADFLLNIGSLNSCQIPCKIFEYMNSGKPIISTYVNENEPSLSYLRKYPKSLLIKESDSLNKDNINALKVFIHEQTGKKVDVKAIEEDFYKATPKAFIELLENLK